MLVLYPYPAPTLFHRSTFSHARCCTTSSDATISSLPQAGDERQTDSGDESMRLLDVKRLGRQVQVAAPDGGVQRELPRARPIRVVPRDRRERVRRLAVALRTRYQHARTKSGSRTRTHADVPPARRLPQVLPPLRLEHDAASSSPSANEEMRGRGREAGRRTTAWSRSPAASY
jgi:hypothetical protein